MKICIYIIALCAVLYASLFSTPNNDVVAYPTTHIITRTNGRGALRSKPRNINRNHLGFIPHAVLSEYLHCFSSEALKQVTAWFKGLGYDVLATKEGSRIKCHSTTKPFTGMILAKVTTDLSNAFARGKSAWLGLDEPNDGVIQGDKAMWMQDCNTAYAHIEGWKQSVMVDEQDIFVCRVQLTNAQVPKDGVWADGMTLANNYDDAGWESFLCHGDMVEDGPNKHWNPSLGLTKEKAIELSQGTGLVCVARWDDYEVNNKRGLLFIRPGYVELRKTSCVPEGFPVWVTDPDKVKAQTKHYGAIMQPDNRSRLVMDGHSYGLDKSAFSTQTHSCGTCCGLMCGEPEGCHLIQLSIGYKSIVSCANCGIMFKRPDFDKEARCCHKCTCQLCYDDPEDKEFKCSGCIYDNEEKGDEDPWK